MIVADTNLIAYLWIPGVFTPLAEKVLKRDPVWAAPLLWRSEFRNVLSGLVRQGAVGMDIARRVLFEAERQMKGREFAVPSDLVLDLAVSSGCSAYDCEFVALARDLDAPLVTQDRKLLAAFRGIAVSAKSFSE